MEILKRNNDLNTRQFLMKFIIPVLTEGMIDVWKVGPIDPVEYLSEYIFKRSGEFREEQKAAM
jgi:adenylate kinase